jgi:DNA-binding transcriptional LysR family regulator
LAPLVHRTTRRLSLTEAGAAYLDKAERILGELREADAEAAAQSVTIEGLLRVSAPPRSACNTLARWSPPSSSCTRRSPSNWA